MIKKKFAWFAVMAAIIMSLFGLAACGGETTPPDEKKIDYTGTYHLYSVNYLMFDLEIGKSGILGFLTKDLAVLEVKEDGTMTFESKIAMMLSFRFSGTWTADEEDETKLTARLTDEDGKFTIVKATYNDENGIIILDYSEDMGAVFTMKKD